MRSRLVIVALTATLLASGPALADHQEAVKLFEEGRRLRDAKELESAVRVFERSIREEPSIGAYYNLGLVNEQLDRPRDAADAYRAARALAQKKNDSRVGDAVDALGKLLDTRSYITLLVPDDVATLPGLRVVVNGQEIPRARFNGEVFDKKLTTHEVVATAPGRKDVRLTVANKQPVTVAFALGTPATAPAFPPPSHDPTSVGGHGWGWQKQAGVSMIGGGLISLVVTGVIFFPYLGDRLSLNSEVSDKCPNAQCSNTAEGHDLLDRNNANVRSGDRKRPAIIATSVLGALLVGVGTYLYVTAPAASASPSPSVGSGTLQLIPQVGLRESGASLMGTF